jgi:hypothetical protein
MRLQGVEFVHEEGKKGEMTADQPEEVGPVTQADLRPICADRLQKTSAWSRFVHGPAAITMAPFQEKRLIDGQCPFQQC